MPVVNTTIPVVQTSSPIYGSSVVSLDQDNKSEIETYTRDWKGVINLSEYVNGTWSVGKEVSELDTSNGEFNGENLTAQNATPIMALSYVNFANELIVSSAVSHTSYSDPGLKYGVSHTGALPLKPNS